MPDEAKTLCGSLVVDLRIWWRHVHTLYSSFAVSFDSTRSDTPAKFDSGVIYLNESQFFANA